MKKIIPIFTSLFLILASCSKDDSSTPSSPEYSTPYQVIPIPGLLKVNISDLLLNVGSTRVVTVTKYSADGTPQTTPTLFWTSSDPTIATVSNGIITAVEKGSCEITVNDGSQHNAIVNVKILEVGQQIPTTAVQADFATDLLVMQPSSNKNIPSFTLHSRSGAVVNAPITFLPPEESGLNFSGNTVSSSNIEGDFNVLLRVGNDTLANALRIHVMNLAQTTRSIRVIGNTFPSIFYDNNVSSPRPVLIEVTENSYVSNVLVQNIFVTSPDKIELNDDSVILNAQGYLTSVHQSVHNYFSQTDEFLGFHGCVAKVIYKDQYFEAGIDVAVNVTGNWGISMSNGDNYNYCIQQTGKKLDYAYNGFYTYGYAQPDDFTHYINGTYYIKKNGEPFYYGPSNSFSGNYLVTTGLASGHGVVRIHHDGQALNYFETFGLEENGNTLTNQNVSLIRGSGTCPPIVVTNPDLILHDVLSGHTWLTNECFQADDGYASSITLNSNGTWAGTIFESEPWLDGEYPTTWYISSNQQIQLRFMIHSTSNINSPLVEGEEYFGPPVSTFNETTINFIQNADCLPFMTRQ